MVLRPPRQPTSLWMGRSGRVAGARGAGVVIDAALRRMPPLTWLPRPLLRPRPGCARSRSTRPGFRLSRTPTASVRFTAAGVGAAGHRLPLQGQFRRIWLAFVSTAYVMTTSGRTVVSLRAAVPVAKRAIVRASARRPPLSPGPSEAARQALLVLPPLGGAVPLSAGGRLEMTRSCPALCPLAARRRSPVVVRLPALKLWISRPLLMLPLHRRPPRWFLGASALTTLSDPQRRRPRRRRMGASRCDRVCSSGVAAAGAFILFNARRLSWSSSRALRRFKPRRTPCRSLWWPWLAVPGRR